MQITFLNLLYLAIAGALGTLSRYGLGVYLQHRFADLQLPLGTIVVNVSGCFLFGLLWAMERRYGWFSEEARIIICTGFMGAFTTFSTYIFDTHFMIVHEQAIMKALGNLLFQNVIGIAAFFLAVKLVR